MAELTATVGFKAIGADTVTAMAIQTGQHEFNAMVAAMGWNLLHFGEILRNTIRELVIKCVDGISAKEDRCRRSANATISIALALNPYSGYAPAEIAKKSVERKRPLADIELQRNLLGKGTIRKILDPMRMTKPEAPIKQGLWRSKRKTGKS